MNYVSEKIAAGLSRAIRGLETRRGRLGFWIFVGVVGLALGAQAVIRAEVPKRVHVDELSHASPMKLGSSADEQADWRSSEFSGFRRLSWGAVVQGIDQYRDLHTRAYPPFFAILFFPFAVLWRCRGAGSTLFFLLGYGSSILSAWCLARWWQGREEEPRFGLFALLWLLMLPFTAAILLRLETDMLVILPLSGALLFLARSRRRYLAGGLLGFAASMKVLPGLFGVYLIAQRRWKALGGMIAAGLLCTVFLPALVWGPQGAWDRHVSWYRHVVAPYGGGGADEVIGRPYRSTNQSLAAAVHRFFTDIRAGKRGDYRRVNVADLSGTQAGRIVTALHGLIGLGLVALWFFAARREGSRAAMATVFATVPLGTLLLSEVSLTGHHVGLLIPVAVLIVRGVCRAEPRARWWLWAVAAALLLCVVGVQRTVKLFSPLLGTTLLLSIASIALAIRDARRPPDDGAASEGAPTAPVPPVPVSGQRS